MDLFSRKAYQIEAETPHEAMKIAKAAHPEYIVDLITDGKDLSESPDICEACGEYVLENEVGAYEPEQGSFYCQDCYGAILDDQSNYSVDTITLCRIFNELGEIIDYDDAAKVETAVNYLKSQNHSAESISCYLQLHGMYYGYVPDLANALIENEICKN